MKRDAGFTLLEILVALVVLGFVVAGLSQGLRFGLRATERMERLSVERGDLDAVDRLLRRLVTQMDPGTARTPSAIAGDQASLAFPTDLGAAASALATTHADVLLQAQAGRLVLRWRPTPHVVPLVPPPPPQDTVLLDGIDRIELSYWGAAGEAPPAWRSEWNQKTLPLLVRIRLVFPPASPPASTRHWPDIVAAPARPRPPP